MESIDSRLQARAQNTAERKKASACLSHAGHRALPDYCPDFLSASQLSRAIKYAGLARGLFAVEASNDSIKDDRELANVMIEAATYGYDGHSAVPNPVADPAFCPLENVPDELSCLYSPQNGILTLGGLKVWLGVMTISGRPPSLVVSFSGTSFNYGQIKADLGQVVACSEVYLHAAGLAEILLDFFPKGTVYFVGHSLGGGLAQFALAAAITPDNERRLNAYCFNAAGLNFLAYESLSAKGTLYLAKKHVFHYKVDGEPVSAIFGHIGKVVVLRPDSLMHPIEKHRIATLAKLLDKNPA